jgi:methanol---5-hydroxybenzimidazolylcobamide Co-methyltransferase
LMQCDLPQVIFSLCVLGARDMRFLWTNICDIAGKTGSIAAGDTACGFGNTAMVLAEQGMIPRTFAAVVRAISAVRSLVAYECGAVGPGKDCGYENPILKAITGYPMAMEGKSAACAHGSPVGNIAACTCDTWSNESVQNVRLLGGMAPTVSVEQLIYDCRLMNRALADGDAGARTMQRWMVESDAGIDPQAYVLAPQSCIEIAKAIVGSRDYYRAGCAAALAAVDLLQKAYMDKRLSLSEREEPWLEMMRQSVEELPDREDAFIERMLGVVDMSRFSPAEYDLEGAA